MNDILPDEAGNLGAIRGNDPRLAESLRLPPDSHADRRADAALQACDRRSHGYRGKEMYSFEDALNGELLTLRPEGTASCVRAAIQHKMLSAGPQRLYYHGPMYRHERPQKGRYRQFHQVGVEALGFEGPDVDAEHILMCARLWDDLGLEDVNLELNSLGSSEGGHATAKR